MKERKKEIFWNQQTVTELTQTDNENVCTLAGIPTPLS
jgi:uncharacterized cysteine cluster protein YcgN (CxxCxxCC family)